MADYTLYYWPVPFRGQFIRAVLTHVRSSWDEAGVDAVGAHLGKAPSEQRVPHMGPPVLIDHAAGFALAQTPAILGYLGAKYRLDPQDPARAAVCAKLVADANDVLYEMTLFNGAQMWTAESWHAYRPRLKRWMAIFEATGRHHGLTAQAGYLLATEAPSVADLTAYVLWSTMTDKLPSLRPMLAGSAPAIAGLCERIAARPEQAELRVTSDAHYGDAWCSGQIEASLRAALQDPPKTSS